MTARAYTPNAFVAGLALKAKTPIIMIQTESSCASGMRFGTDLPSLNDDTIEALQDEGLAFLTFDNVDAALAAHDQLIMDFPEPGRTTLGASFTVGLSNGKALVFEQPHGGDRNIFEI